MSGPAQARLELRPSPRLAALILALHLAAGASLYATLGGLAGAALAALAAALGVAAARDRALMKAPGSPKAIVLADRAEGRVETADGRTLAIGAGARRVNRFWVSVPLAAPARRTLLVTADMLPERDFRRLRLWALWGRLPGVASGQLPG